MKKGHVMKTVLTTCIALAASGMLLKPLPAYSKDGTASVEDIVLLAQSDISQQTILTFLKHRKLDFAVDADAVKSLREGGVGDEIIRYLSQPDATPTARTPAYVVATGYSTSYPSYYFGARLVGTTAYPLSWYNHHYYPPGYASVFRPGAHYGPSSSVGHSDGASLVHDSLYAPGVHGGNPLLDHSALRPEHYGQEGRNHSRGYGREHSLGH
jgi:hypothetical protein